MNPYYTSAVRVTSGDKVIVGGYEVVKKKAAVFVIDKDGKHRRSYLNIKRDKVLFRYPKCNKYMYIERSVAHC